MFGKGLGAALTLTAVLVAWALPAAAGPTQPESGRAAPPGGPFRGADRAILDAITQGSPAVVTILAIFSALVLGGLVIAFSATNVLHSWNSFFAAPGAAISATWQAVASAYSALFEGAIVNPHTVTAAFHGGSVGAIFYPLSQTASQATPLSAPNPFRSPSPFSSPPSRAR